MTRKFKEGDVVVVPDYRRGRGRVVSYVHTQVGVVWSGLWTRDSRSLFREEFVFLVTEPMCH